jgi:cysteine desulfurase
LDGGVQEGNKRAGAENIIGIVAMGVAAKLAKQDMDSRIAHTANLRDKLLGELPDHIDEYIINGHPEHCLPNLVSMSIKYIEGESVVLMVDDEKISISTRSACATGSLRTSHVLVSIGREYADAQGTLVVTFGVDNTEEDVNRFLSALKDVVGTLRDISPLYKKAPSA